MKLDRLPAFPELRSSLGWAVFLVLFASSAPAQRVDLGSWNILQLKFDPAGKWDFFAEAQLRSLGFYDDFHYHEFKGGVGYAVHDKVKLTLGGGKYDTYREGGDFITPKANDEYRLWPQLVLQQTIGRVKVEQRYRMEMRFSTNGYRNRFRYRLGLSYPFALKRGLEKRWTASAGNELFFTDKEPYFERNRLNLSVNYKFSPFVSLQAGYLHQFDYKIFDETGRDFLVMGFFVDLSELQKQGNRTQTSPSEQ